MAVERRATVTGRKNKAWDMQEKMPSTRRLAMINSTAEESAEDASIQRINRSTCPLQDAALLLPKRYSTMRYEHVLDEVSPLSIVTHAHLAPDDPRQQTSQISNSRVQHKSIAEETLKLDFRQLERA